MCAGSAAPSRGDSGQRYRPFHVQHCGYGRTTGGVHIGSCDLDKTDGDNMTFAPGLCLFLLCCLVPTLSVKEKSTDHRLIYQSEDIIKQQDAEEAKLKNLSALGKPYVT